MEAAFAAAGAAIRAAFGEPVTYTGAGLPKPAEIAVIWSDVAGDPFQGSGNTTRTISCEVDRSLLPRRPSGSDRIVRKSVAWKPQQVVDRDDVNAWAITLEQA